MAQTANLGLPLIDGSMTADVPRDMNALAQAVDVAVIEAIGNVEVPLSDATDGTRSSVAASEKAVGLTMTEAKAAKSIANAASVTAAAAETPAGAQAKADAAKNAAISAAASDATAKANAAETNAKNASLPRTGGKLTGEGPLLGLVGNTHSYIEFYPEGLAAGRKGYAGYVDAGNKDLYIVNSNGDIYFNYKNGELTSLSSLKQSVSDGKTAIASAITDKGIPASGSDTFSQLATKIGQINTGKRVASGGLGNLPAGSAFSVGGLAFTPSLVTINYTDNDSNGTKVTIFLMGPTNPMYNHSSPNGVYLAVATGSSSNSIPRSDAYISGNSFYVQDHRTSYSKNGVTWIAYE